MRKTEIITEAVIELTRRIETQIRDAKLAPGTTFKTTAELAKEYGVSTARANLAMRLLVQRGIVERRTRVGTVIADFQTRKKSSSLEKIHFLLPGTACGARPELLNDLMMGLQSIFPQAEIGILFFEQEQSAAKISELIKANSNQAFILVRAPLDLQRLMFQSKLPAVILGHPFPSINLSWMDIDCSEQGRLVAEEIVKERCTSALVLLQNRIAPGDHSFSDGLKTELQSADWSFSNLTERFVPSDSPVISDTVETFLKTRKERCAVITRSLDDADMVFKVLKKIKAQKRAFLITTKTLDCHPHQNGAYTAINWDIDLFEMGTRLGELLRTHMANPSAEPAENYTFAPVLSR